MIYTGKKVYDPLTDTYSTGYWIKDNKGYWYPVWRKWGRRMTRFSTFSDEELDAMESAFCNEGLGFQNQCFMPVLIAWQN